MLGNPTTSKLQGSPSKCRKIKFDLPLVAPRTKLSSALRISAVRQTRDLKTIFFWKLRPDWQFQSQIVPSRFEILVHPATSKVPMLVPKCRICAFDPPLDAPRPGVPSALRLSTVQHTFDRMASFLWTLDKNSHFVNVWNVTCLPRNRPFLELSNSRLTLLILLQDPSRPKLLWNEVLEVSKFYSLSYKFLKISKIN